MIATEATLLVRLILTVEVEVPVPVPAVVKLLVVM